MIVNENITTYIHSLIEDGPGWLENLREEAEKQKVPIIRREMEPFIRVLLKMISGRNILEIGTGIGYSSLFMNSCIPDAQILTVENYEPRLIQARKNLAGKENIVLKEGDAADVIRDLEGPFDLIFLDGPKAQYISMLPDLLRLMQTDSILLADNVLQEGELIKSRYITPRRQRTIHSRMREFLWTVTHHPRLDSSLITIGDGVILSRKI